MNLYNFFKKFKLLKKIIPRIIIKKIKMKIVSPYSNIENDNNFIFIHIPKTAGNGIIMSLYDQKTPGHFPALWYKKYDKKKFNRYFKFAIVRNPWDRIVSAFFYLKEGGMIEEDKNFSNEYLKKFDKFEDFILSLENRKFRKTILSWTHFIPQYKFVFNRKDGIMVDYLGRYENLENSYIEISNKLKKRKPLRKDNPSTHKPFYEYYNHKMIKIVEKIYKKDIDLFNYNFPFKELENNT